jgi:hypothetical protein
VVQHGVGDASFVYFVTNGSISLASLLCRIFVLKWAKRIGQKLWRLAKAYQISAESIKA